MDKIKVFVAVPMSGKEDAVIERSIQIAKAYYLKATGKSFKEVEFYDNYHGCKGSDFDKKLKTPALGYLSVAFFELADCDAAVFGHGWMDAKGCAVEHRACAAYDIPMYVMK